MASRATAALQETTQSWTGSHHVDTKHLGLIFIEFSYDDQFI